MKLVDTPKYSVYGKHGFVCAIEFPKSHCHMSFETWLRSSELRAACRKMLGKEYRIDWKRPGMKNKWAEQECRTFVRYHFKSEAVRFMILMGK